MHLHRVPLHHRGYRPGCLRSCDRDSTVPVRSVVVDAADLGCAGHHRVHRRSAEIVHASLRVTPEGGCVYFFSKTAGTHRSGRGEISHQAMMTIERVGSALYGYQREQDKQCLELLGLSKISAGAPSRYGESDRDGNLIGSSGESNTPRSGGKCLRDAFGLSPDCCG